MIRKLAIVLVAVSLMATPSFATPMVRQAPAARSGLAQADAGGSAVPAVRRSGVPGGGLIAAVILAAVIGVGVLLATQDDDADSG